MFDESGAVIETHESYALLATIKIAKQWKRWRDKIEQGMHGEWRHCAIYEKDLERLWPLDEKDREVKIAQFAAQYGFRLRFYSKGMCAIFDKWPRQMGK